MDNIRSFATTVHTFSKTATLIVFVVLVWLSFYLGMLYQKNVDALIQAAQPQNAMPARINEVQPQEEKIFHSNLFDMTFKYSSDWKIEEAQNLKMDCKDSTVLSHLRTSSTCKNDTNIQLQLSRGDSLLTFAGEPTVNSLTCNTKDCTSKNDEAKVGAKTFAYTIYKHNDGTYGLIINNVETGSKCSHKDMKILSTLKNQSELDEVLNLLKSVSFTV